MLNMKKSHELDLSMYIEKISHKYKIYAKPVLSPTLYYGEHNEPQTKKNSD